MNDCKTCIFREAQEKRTYECKVHERLIRKTGEREIYKCTKELTDKEFCIAVKGLNERNVCPYFE